MLYFIEYLLKIMKTKRSVCDSTIKATPKSTLLKDKSQRFKRIIRTRKHPIAKFFCFNKNLNLLNQKPRN